MLLLDVVFGELIEGDNVLRQLELCGTRSGNPTAKITIDECGEVKKEGDQAKWVKTIQMNYLKKCSRYAENLLN